MSTTTSHTAPDQTDTAQLTVAVVGAGGKMGMRVSNNLQRSNHTVYYAGTPQPGGRGPPRPAGP